MKDQESDPNREAAKTEAVRAQPESSAAESSRRASGTPYTAKPSFESRRATQRWWAAGLALLLAAAIGGARLLAPVPLLTPSQPPAATGVADVKHEKVFLVALKDLDVKKTEDARQKLTAGLMPSELASAPQAVRDAVRDGRMSLFTLHMIDFVDEDGDVVDVSINGMTMGQVILSHAGATMTVPLTPGIEQSFGVTAVQDGGGGVTFGAQSSAGQMVTRVMGVGESEVWTLTFK